MLDKIPTFKLQSRVNNRFYFFAIPFFSFFTCGLVFCLLHIVSLFLLEDPWHQLSALDRVRLLPLKRATHDLVVLLLWYDSLALCVRTSLLQFLLRFLLPIKVKETFNCFTINLVLNIPFAPVLVLNLSLLFVKIDVRNLWPACKRCWFLTI